MTDVPEPAVAIARVAAAFVCGSVPFSVWIGRWALGTDIRRYGDGNPGATNVFRAGGVGGCDSPNFKGGLDGAALVAVALAGPLGHAFSPFLGLRV